MKLCISFVLAASLLLPAPLFAKEAPKAPVKKAAAAKPAKKAAPKKTIAPVKKSIPKTALKKPAALPLKKQPAQKPASSKQIKTTEVQSQTPEKSAEPPLVDTKSKAKELLKKLEEIKNIEPVKLKPIEKPSLPEQKYWLDQPTKDAPVRDYYKDHPGSYSPPLLKYDLPSGVY